jgi:hypothetical protein
MPRPKGSVKIKKPFSTRKPDGRKNNGRNRPTGYKLPSNHCIQLHRNIKESEVLKGCKQYLERQDSVWWRRIDGGGKLFRGQLVKSENQGFPDLLIVNKGLIIGVELKRPYQGRLSEEQSKFLCSIIKHGGVGAVVTSVLGLIKLLHGELPDHMLETKSGVIPTWY